ncbi:plasma membrane protein Pth11-like protein [Metarhizium guizhouense ARSEF 977]|uniref:Plasma membrane protein Pth11-like protein n=1 Tax=Metarhizium guizhouense (strain ARSEF 977) TaxID=1276136 RepID=A0A0B4GJY9_METGA|nr:plasma membrane protein Pth11-like protein [Metarhizium guizhouense ARSEF 977]
MVLVGFMVLIGLWTVAFFFATVFYCKTNFFAIWGSALDLMTFCTKGMLRSLALCISDFITDVFIIAFPIPTVATSLARMITTIRIVKAGFDPNEDEVFVITTWVYWGMVECSTGILAACLPTLSFFTRSVVFERPWDTLASAFGTRSRSSPAGDDGDTLPYKAGHGGTVHTHSKPRPSHDTTEEAYEMANGRAV